MMEGAGLLLMTLAFGLMLVPPLHIAIAGPRIGAVHVAAKLPESYQLAPPRTDMDALIREADEALANDPLIRASAAIARANNQA